MADIATATRAVRDLDGNDFEGRPLKLDFAAPKGGLGGVGGGFRGGRSGVWMVNYKAGEEEEECLGEGHPFG